MTYDPESLPEGLELLAPLNARGDVLHVRDAGGEWVARVIDPGQALEAEWHALTRVGHTRVVVPTRWEADRRGRTLLLRPYLDGATLAERAAGATVEQLVRWTRDLLEALHALHERGLVHRDVKATNVIVHAERAHLVDLDLVGSMHAGSARVGTLCHIAPEVLLGEPATARSDLFAVGVTLALALIGEPSPSFAQRFPARGFWAAAELDPDRIPDELRPLVRSLVMRWPQDRPPSARTAVSLLPGAPELPAGDLALPPLAGRDTALRALARSLGTGACIEVLGVRDAEELEAAAGELHLACALEGRTVRRVTAAREADLTALRTAEAESVELVVIDAGVEPWALVELLVGASHDPRPDHDLVVVAPHELASAARDQVERSSAAERVRWRTLPRVPLNALEEHLLRLSQSSAPRAATALAADLHERTVGRQAALDRLLRGASDAGVLERLASGWAVLRETWPDDLPPEAALRATFERLPDDSRRLARALALAGGACSASALGDAVELGGRRLGRALAELRAAGALRDRGRPALAEAGWSAAATEGLSPADRRALATDLLVALEPDTTPRAQLAALRMEAADDAAALRIVLDDAQQVRTEGALGAARRLAQAVSLRREHPSIAGAACVLLAQLDLGQSNASRAQARLEGEFGPQLEDAPHAALLAAGDAAELCGRRADARALYERVLAGRPTADDELRAYVRLGHAYLLDGDLEGALAVAPARPRADDPDEPAGSLHNLRAGALAQLGRFDEAARELEQAMVRAEVCGDPTLLGRTELNRGFLDRRRGRVDHAAAALARAVAAFDRAENVRLRALAANNCGVVERARGELHRAQGLLGRALELRLQVQDAYGAASSRGSLALATLESGQLVRAQEALAAASVELERGGHESERALLESHLALAAATMGDPTRALGLLERAGIDARSPIACRVRALVALVRGEHDEALQGLRDACAELPPETDGAEAFRAIALWCALDPEDEAARRALGQWGERLGSLRCAEAAWRTRDRGRVPVVAQLRRWLTTFEGAGRIDLVRVTARALADELDGSEAAGERRRVSARASAAAETLTAGLPPADTGAVLERLERMAGGSTETRGPRGLDVAWFLASNRAMAACQDQGELLDSILDMALEATGARRGFLVLEDGERAATRAARGMRGALDDGDVQLSRTVVSTALESRAPVVTLNAADDARFASMDSVRSLALRSVLCVPLLADETRGVIYVDNDQIDAVFDERDVDAVRALADQAAIAIRQRVHQREIEALNERLQERVEFQRDELTQARARLRSSGATPPVGGLIGESAAMRSVHALIQRLAPTDLPVLVTGPSGSGKELVARALHEHSLRSSGPLVVENVAALPETLLESELFGHVRGAFTGAVKDHEGLFARADGGTFFLDEIGDLPSTLQAKVLRVLEAGEYRPVGTSEARRADVRIVAATHHRLAERVEQGLFREDLYYRLNASGIAVPPLSERDGDVPLLVAHFLAEVGARHGRPKEIAPSVLAALVARDWPGQVRELSNEVTRLYFLSEERVNDPALVRAPELVGMSSDPMPASLLLEDVERAAVQRALRVSEGRRDRAAQLLGISRSGLYTKLRRLGLESAP